MSPCFHPLRAFIVEGSGGRKILWSYHRRGKQINLPCGRCLGCRIERSRQWAVRITHEASLYEENSYLTLTYDDEHLPKGNTLVVEHLQLFMKRLRQEVKPVRVRFFACGEYGEKFQRAHYHVILFGYWFPDSERDGKSKSGHDQWRSETLSRVWGAGRATIGRVCFETAQYVAGYVTKKVDGDRAPAHYRGKKKEFAVMSRRPGIGAAWLVRYRDDVYPSDEVVLKGRRSKPPRYYDKVGLRLCDMATATILQSRESAACESGSVEESVRVEGSPERVRLPAVWNGRRLRSSETVARRKLALKTRDMEA